MIGEGKEESSSISGKEEKEKAQENKIEALVRSGYLNAHHKLRFRSLINENRSKMKVVKLFAYY